MSGTGRPQYITKKGSTDPAQSYIPSKQNFKNVVSYHDFY